VSLKKDLVCPTCDGRELWRIETMMERSAGGQPEPIGVLLEPRVLRAALAHGKFETLICNSCGYTEWYAQAIKGLRHDPINGVHFIKNDVEVKGPYR
jgi:hypothetical protein